jgi:hypothetical protein
MVRAGLAIVASFAAALAISARASADECQTATDCYNAATWQRAVASDYSNKAAWFREMSRQNFIDAKQWGDKATFAFHAGDAVAAAWYKGIADDYARKAVDNAKAADDYANRAKFVSAAAAGSQDRGNWLQSCGDAETCSRMVRPAGLTDAQWFTTVSQLDPSMTQVDLPPETFSCPPGEVCTASAAAPHGCKTINNPREKMGRVDPNDPIFGKGRYWAPLIQITFKTTWCYRNGDITRMDPPDAYCKVTTLGRIRGWACDNPDGHAVFPAKRTGGNPEHGAWIYSFTIHQSVYIPWLGEVVKIRDDRWCAGNQVSASGAHKRHGRCSLQSW